MVINHLLTGMILQVPGKHRKFVRYVPIFFQATLAVGSLVVGGSS